VNHGPVGGSLNSAHHRAYGYGNVGTVIGFGGSGYGYGNGGYGYVGYGSGYSYANVACYITDPTTGFVYYCPYGLGGWQGWGSGWLPAGAYRVR
jgi:hypothetical protein